MSLFGRAATGTGRAVPRASGARRPAYLEVEPEGRHRTERVDSRRRPAVEPKDDVLRRERHQPDWSILVAVVALAAIGILMVYSSSAMRAYVQQDDTLAIVGPQILWAALGLIAMLVMMRVDYRLLRMASLPGYAMAVGLLILVFVPGLNKVVGGSARWLAIGGFPAIHPAEIAKLALIIYLAHWLSSRGSRVAGFRTGTIPFLLISLPIIGLVFKEPDLGTTTVIAATAFTMFFVAGARLWQFAAMGGMGVVSALVVGLQQYQITRIRTFIDPWSDPLGTGFHTIQGLLALGLGGIFGAGLGESKLAGGLYLPNAWNDFIFAIIGEELGFIGCLLVLGLFVGLGLIGLRIALRAPDRFGMLIATGVTAWVVGQAAINLGAVIGVLPVSGVPLPFLSVGGTSLVITMFSVGVVANIARQTQPLPTRTRSKSPERPVPARAS